ncbi:hypothetical protein H6F89_30805 [Cyanobacteria bacterium FACHB-63]|nr:hypothetical protein [Cyanobacteria bacterium FACHB-63]
MNTIFLLSIGYWNLMGSIALYLMLNKAIADRLLREWTWIIAAPYEVGRYGNLWLVWAATTNTFFGAINLFAAHWESMNQIAVIWADLFVYGVFLLSAIVVLKGNDYGKGHFINIGLFIFWSLWAVYLLVHH